MTGVLAFIQTTEPVASQTVEPGIPAPSIAAIFQGYAGVLIVAFLVSMIATPIMRRLAVANGVVDHPSDPRKVHRMPIAYMGGVAVYLGLIAGILFAIAGTRVSGLIDWHPSEHALVALDRVVPLSVLLGATIIMLLGLLDDIIGISPRLKIAGQLFAAAALAYQNIGVKVAEGALRPVFEFVNVPSVMTYVLPDWMPGGGMGIEFDAIYWTGAVIIAVGVVGACNASNLIDGLDGLLTGVTAIALCGILVLSLDLAAADDGVRDSQRLVLALATLGACLGFLPHNFNPATIFLGDAGSMLLGYCSIVAILTLGDTGKTHLVVAGLIIYAIPLIDTLLAIIRRKLAGARMSDADSNHLHHMLKRALGVKGAVFTLYAIGAGFAVLGAASSYGRARIVYLLALLFATYIGVIAIKIARREQIESQALQYAQKRAIKPTSPPTAPTASPAIQDRSTGDADPTKAAG